mgnify:CR=1 FL=1
MTSSVHSDSTDRVLTQIAKLLTQAMHAKSAAGEILAAERLSVCRDLLGAPNLREPVLPVIPQRVHQKR